MHKYSTIPVRLQAAGIWVNGYQYIPPNPLANVVFSLGNALSYGQDWVQALASGMLEKGFAVLCTDLQTEDEEDLYSNQFAIQLNADRLSLLTQWTLTLKQTAALPVLYFSYQLGTPAALLAAAGNQSVSGIVSFSGRPEQVLDKLQWVKQPVLLIYGKEDTLGISLSQESCAAIGGIAEVQSVEGKGQPASTRPEELLRVSLHWFNACLNSVSGTL